jgi:hypothetical protein
MVTGLFVVVNDSMSTTIDLFGSIDRERNE